MGGATKLLLLLASPFPRPSALRLARRPAAPLAAISSSAAYSSLRGRRPSLLSSGPRLRIGFSLGAAEQVHTQAVSAREAYGEGVSSAPTSSPAAAAAAHPWPEWSRLVEHVVAGGYYDRRRFPASIGEVDDDSFVAAEGLTEEFVKAAEACISFARDRPDLLRLLPKKDIEIMVDNGSPFLFKNGANSTRRLKSFLHGDETNALVSEKEGTIDLMRYLLSNVCNSFAIQDEANMAARELIQASTRTLLVELVNVCAAVQPSRSTETTPKQAGSRFDMPSRVPTQNIEMKRGDWICPKCSFMNFARNMRCLECNDARPKRVLTGGEWECPQCDFFNYGRNMSCLRCDCRRPGGENSLNTADSNSGLGYNGSSAFEQVVKGSNIDKSEIERKLAANDEKAERWFSKMSQLGDGADLSSAIDDEDFPEIMPMRKGVNRFVVSTRKTPLERRLANAKNHSDVSSPVSEKGIDSGSGGLTGMGSGIPSESSISQSLDRILGRSSTSSGPNSQVASGERNIEAGNNFSSSEFNQRITNQRTDSNYVPSVPLPPDMFSRSTNANNEQSQNKDDPSSIKADQPSEFMHRSSTMSKEGKNDEDSSYPTAKWSTKVAKLDNVKDLANAIPDDDFPDIMPMRKGENRFVISKKKDRTLTSPQYKRRIAMEQANNSNFVPFVPFPPDYFAKKDKQPPEASPTVESASEGLVSHEKAQSVPEKLEDSKSTGSNLGFGDSTSVYSESTSQSSVTPRTNYSIEGVNERKVNSAFGRAASNSAGLPGNSWSNQNETWNSRYSQKSTHAGASPANSQQSSSQSGREDWKPSFSGKSLEGSAVSEEPDPLDMSEEAKAARWFRRVAQIKDISELSNIPDEDFPEIMPMRKGVNRFVVSKRKTPLERRLTSPQYRRNLPIISSEPEKDTS